MKHFTILALAMVLCIAAIASSQGAPGSISGRVFDATGAMIPGVKVTLRGATVETSAVTDRTGAFSFSQLPPDGYRLEAFLPDFKTTTMNVALAAGASVQRDLPLQISSIETVIQIQGQRLPPASNVATSPLPPRPIRVGGDVAQAQLVFALKPVYPDSARAAGIQGVVSIQAVIGKDGSVLAPVPISANDPRLTQAALDAVRQWRYRPTLLNGEPVEISTTITVNFTLTN
jgi:TonB family protein